MQSSKAIIFDIDGTLYSNKMMFAHTPHIYMRSFLWIYRYHKMRQKLREYCMHHIPRFDVSKVVDLDVYQSSLFWEKSIELFAEEIGVARQQAQYLLEKRVYTMWIQAVRNLALRRGMRNLLGKLHRRGVPLGILSDFRSIEKIKNWNLESYFSTILCAEDFAKLKPSPELFELSCAKIGYDAKDTIYVGNSLKYDGFGALQAGLTPVLFHKKKYVQSCYDIKVVQNVAQLERFLIEHNVL